MSPLEIPGAWMWKQDEGKEEEEQKEKKKEEEEEEEVWGRM